MKDFISAHDRITTPFWKPIYSDLLGWAAAFVVIIIFLLQFIDEVNYVN